MMRRIAVVNQKGGSAKTTSAVNVCAAMAERGMKPLLLDLDPQANATMWTLGAEPLPEVQAGLLHVLTNNDGELGDLVQPSRLEGVDIIPSSPLLGSCERALATEIGAETILRRAVERLPDRWDCLLVDCPPALSLLTISALVACDAAIVPVEAHVLALSGLAALMDSIQRVRDRLNPSLEIQAIIACRVDQRTRLAREVVDSLRERFGDLVLETTVRESVRLAEAPSFAMGIAEYDPAGTGTEDYRKVVAELMIRAERQGGRN